MSDNTNTAANKPTGTSIDAAFRKALTEPCCDLEANGGLAAIEKGSCNDVKPIAVIRRWRVTTARVFGMDNREWDWIDE